MRGSGERRFLSEMPHLRVNVEIFCGFVKGVGGVEKTISHLPVFPQFIAGKVNIFVPNNAITPYLNTN